MTITIIAIIIIIIIIIAMMINIIILRQLLRLQDVNCTRNWLPV